MPRLPCESMPGPILSFSRTAKEKEKEKEIPEPSQHHSVLMDCTLPRPHRSDRSPQYQVGVMDQCRSIVFTAEFHSNSKHWASWSASSGEGSRPPHMSGLAASMAAYAITRLLHRESQPHVEDSVFGSGESGTYSSTIFRRHNHAMFQLRLLSGSPRTRICASARMSPQNG